MSVKEVNEQLQGKSYLGGAEPSKADAEMFQKLMGGAGKRAVADWAARMSGFSAAERADILKNAAAAPAAASAQKEKKEKPADAKKGGDKKAAAAAAAPAPAAAAAAPAAATGPSNFLRDLIKKDLSEGGRIAFRKTDPKHKNGDIVRTRFPPEPNGYLHIGHAKSICLNFGLAKEFGGRCHLRFDDTNPASEKQEYIDAIEEDVKWLGFDWGEHKYYASSYFAQFYEWALHLIRNKDAYVDSQTKEEIIKNRGTVDKAGSNSPFRERSVEENLALFKEMKEGKHAEGTHVLRAKIDMASDNMNLRDPLLYRILYKEHPHTGTDWVIFPIYDFAHGQEDAIEQITHSFCTLEFDAHRPLYNWFLDHLPIEKQYRPIQTEFARLNVSGTVLSKRKLLFLVDEKIVDGWNDPRMPTICGLRRRGIPPAAIRKFCEKIGVTRNFSVVDEANFEDVVREELDTTTPRRFAAIKPLKVTLKDYPADKVEEFEVPNHPKFPEMGTRTLRFSKSFYIDGGDFMENPTEDYFRLKPDGEAMLRACQKIVKVVEVVKGADGAVVELVCTHEASGTRKVPGHIGWVGEKDAVPVTVNLYSTLFKPSSGDDDEEDEAADEAEAGGERKGLTQEEKKAKILKSVNVDSREVLPAVVEGALSGAAAESRYQFERLGYFVVDRFTPADKLVFNRTITLRASGPAKVQTRSRKQEQEEQLRLKKMLENLPPQEMFKVQKDSYSKFDADGVPTHDAEGKDLSKGAIKKLKKEWDKQKKKFDAKK
eukprot:Rhum_TRINITY_DN10791_c0_g1::Rhum_TRINITY_DN10791_c0_g1_i1::g.39773::m.39773/K01886/QARS, glnS; glutaminyl-tRNA synthetase